MSQQSCCPTCGRRLPKPTAPTATGLIDTSKLTSAEVYAYYQRTSAIEDARFWAQHCNVTEIREKFAALAEQIGLQGGKHTPATKARYLALQAEWRETTEEYAEAKGDPTEAPGTYWQKYIEHPTGYYRKVDGVYTRAERIGQPCIIMKLAEADRWILSVDGQSLEQIERTA